MYLDCWWCKTFIPDKTGQHIFGGRLIRKIVPHNFLVFLTRMSVINLSISLSLSLSLPLSGITVRSGTKFAEQCLLILYYPEPSFSMTWFVLLSRPSTMLSAVFLCYFSLLTFLFTKYIIMLCNLVIGFQKQQLNELSLKMRVTDQGKRHEYLTWQHGIQSGDIT